MDILLRHGADLAAVNRLNCQALFYAGLSDKPSASAVIRSLLQAGASPNFRNFLLLTPMLSCLLHNSQDDPENFITPFIEHGADIRARSASGFNAWDIAVRHNRVKSVAFLEKIQGLHKDEKSDLGHAISSNSYEVIQLLLFHGADTNVVSKDGATLLHLAAPLADSRTLDILRNSKLDVDAEAKDSLGRTAMQLFASRDEKDKNLMESFDCLLENVKTQRREAVSLVLDKFTDIDVENPSGEWINEDDTSNEVFFDSMEDWAEVVGTDHGYASSPLFHQSPLLSSC